jgi:hypothetical protein
VAGTAAVGSVVALCKSRKKPTGSILVVLQRSDGKKLKEKHEVRLEKAGNSLDNKPGCSKAATFSGLDPDNYSIVTTLSSRLRGAAIQAGDGTKGVGVVDGQQSKVTVLVDPCVLTVEVVCQDTQGPADGVKVALSGGTSSSEKSSGGVGAKFDELTLNAGHQIALTLPKALAEDYAPPRQIPDITMPAADFTTRIVLLKRPAPVIEIDDPKVVVVAHAYHGQPKPGVPAHRVKVTLKSDIAFDGEGVFTCSPDDIKVFAGPSPDQTALALPLTVPQADLAAGKAIYIEAKKASGLKEGTSLKFKLQNGTIEPKPEATQKITCVKLQLDIHKSRPEPGGDPEKLAEGPKLDPGRPVVLQKVVDRIYFSERAKLLLSRAEPRDYDGNLKLEPITAGVSLFAKGQEEAEDGQGALTAADLTIANTDLSSSSGRVFWVEGTTASAASGDTGWRVSIDGLAGSEGDRVTITVIQADLELSQSRAVIPANGPPAAVAEPFRVGRYLHKQHEQFHGRARLVVKQVAPADFVGTLTLNCYHVSHGRNYSGSTAGSKPRVQVFATEVPAAGDAAIAYPVEIAHDAAYPAAGKEYWIEGSEVSGDKIDTEMRLGVKDYEKGSDRVSFTVVKLKNLKVKIPAAQPGIARPLNPSLWRRGGLKFRHDITDSERGRGGGLRSLLPSKDNGPIEGYKFVAGKNDDAIHYSDDFTVNEYLPVVQGSLAANLIEMTVEVEPKGKNIPVVWDAVRNPLDNAAIATLPGNQAKPTVTQDASDPVKATLNADAGGSFHVVAYVDGNEDSLFNFADAAANRIDREPYVMLNAILYYVCGIAHNTITRDNAGSNGTVKTPSGAFNIPEEISFGDFQGNGDDAIDMDAIVHCVGGGADGQLGLNHLFGGWLNNELNSPGSPGDGGFGEDVTTHYASWPPGTDTGQTRCLWRQNAIAVTGPVLDSGYDNQGTGGESCTGTAGQNAGAPAQVLAGAAGVGENRQYFNVDSPGGGIKLRHPDDSNLFLSQFSFNIDFRCALIFWTGTQAPSDEPCNRLYATAYTNTWSIRFTATYALLVENVTAGPTVTAILDANRNATAVDGSGIETVRPDGLNNLVTDEPY